MANNAFQEYLSIKFRKLLSGASDGIPPWLGVVAEGDEPGLYLPTDAPWVVHADFGTLVGGIRALLMQALHPGSLTGVQNHSRYKQDPLGRLSGTIRWLTVTTFGSPAALAGEASRVNRLHESVKGTYQVKTGKSIDYRASDPDLLLWVHIAFMDSFLRTHQMYSRRVIPGGADNYIALWAKSVEPLGLSTAPMNEAELIAEIERFDQDGFLSSDKNTLEVVSFIKNPPLPRSARLVYSLLFKAAVLTIEPKYLERLGLKQGTRWLIQPATRGLLRFMRFAIGPDSPIEDASIARLQRAGKLPSDYQK